MCRLLHISTGCVGAEPSLVLEETSWTALTLESWHMGELPVSPPSVGDLRVRFVVERSPAYLVLQPTVRFSTTGANMVSRTKERAHDLLPVCSRCLSYPRPAPGRAVNKVCWLRSARLCKRHLVSDSRHQSDTLLPGAALAQHPCSSTAVRATAGCSALPEPQSSAVLKSCVTLAPSQPHSRRVMAEHV